MAKYSDEFKVIIVKEYLRLYIIRTEIWHTKRKTYYKKGEYV